MPHKMRPASHKNCQSPNGTVMCITNRLMAAGVMVVGVAHRSGGQAARRESMTSETYEPDYRPKTLDVEPYAG